MIVVDADQGPHQADVVSNLWKMGEHLRHVHPTIAPLVKFERCAQQLVGFTASLKGIDLNLENLVMA